MVLTRVDNRATLRVNGGHQVEGVSQVRLKICLILALIIIYFPGSLLSLLEITSERQERRRPFRMLSNIWKPKEIGLRTKLKFFNSNVKSVLLYGSETWRATKTTQKLQTFINRCLCKILGIKWMDRVMNDAL